MQTGNVIVVSSVQNAIKAHELAYADEAGKATSSEVIIGHWLQDTLPTWKGTQNNLSRWLYGESCSIK